MSFYLTLTSDGCRETFPSNHGGDFKVQLDQTLDMREHPWEVALVEMIYTGQAFPNLPIEDSQVTVKASGKPQFENDYIITYDQTLYLWLEFKLEKRIGTARELIKKKLIQLPRQHYSWTSFATTLKSLCHQEFRMGSVKLTETDLEFAEVKGNDNLFNMNMSKDFSDLFQIDVKYKQIHDFVGGWTTFRLPIKLPKPATDTSLVFYSPYAAPKNCRMEINDHTIFLLTPQYWSVNMFKRAINALGNDFGKGSWLSSMIIEEGHNPTECTLVLTANKEMNKDEKGHIEVKFSADFAKVFQLGALTFHIKFTESLRIPISIIEANDDDTPWKNYEASRRLRNNFYPTITSLVEELNGVVAESMLDIATRRKSSTKSFTFFSVQNNIVKFEGKDGFTVLLSTGLLTLMNLPSSWLTKSVMGSIAVIMKSYKRSHMYVHLDCLDHHYINNNVSDLLKVIPNSAATDEKVLLTFSDPHYYAVASRYMGIINMYITDDYFEGILRFDRDIAYTLHFRRCV